MKPKFKIGDKVKIINRTDCKENGQIETILDMQYIKELWAYLLNCESIDFINYVSEKNLELVESSEQIAVNKFKEEFRQILQKRLLEHKSCKDYWYDYLKKNSDTINKFDGECIVSDLNKISNYIYELEKVLFLFEKNSCKHKLESEDK